MSQDQEPRDTNLLFLATLCCVTFGRGYDEDGNTCLESNFMVIPSWHPVSTLYWTQSYPKCSLRLFHMLSLLTCIGKNSGKWPLSNLLFSAQDSKCLINPECLTNPMSYKSWVQRERVCVQFSIYWRIIFNFPQHVMNDSTSRLGVLQKYFFVELLLESRKFL